MRIVWKVLKLKEETLQRIDGVFQDFFVADTVTAQKLSKTASWDFKINAIMDRLGEAIARGG